MNVHVLPSDAVLKNAANALNSLFAAERGKEFLFLTSGGSALSLLEHIDTENFGADSTVGVLDERYSEDPKVNNFSQLERTYFFSKVQIKGSQFIDTKVRNGESIQELALRFEMELQNWVNKKNGTIIATVGVGTDAHTAGILPFPEDPIFFSSTFDDPSHFVAAYDAAEKSTHRLRVTTTFPFLQKINSAIILMIGQEKKPALEKLLSEQGTLAESPCRIWREVSGAQLFTDQQ